MTRYLFSIWIFIAVTVSSLHAQQEPWRGKMSDEQRKANFEKFKADREKYISEEVGLTREEATAFWPLCNELQDEKFELNRTMRRELRAIYDAIKNGQKVPEEDYDKVINRNAETRTKEVELEKEYLKQFRKFLSAEKVFKYQRAEQRFARKMMNTR